MEKLSRGFRYMASKRRQPSEWIFHKIPSWSGENVPRYIFPPKLIRCRGIYNDKLYGKRKRNMSIVRDSRTFARYFRPCSPHVSSSFQGALHCVLADPQLLWRRISRKYYRPLCFVDMLSSPFSIYPSFYDVCTHLEQVNNEKQTSLWDFSLDQFSIPLVNSKQFNFAIMSKQDLSGRHDTRRTDSKVPFFPCERNPLPKQIFSGSSFHEAQAGYWFV